MTKNINQALDLRSKVIMELKGVEFIVYIVFIFRNVVLGLCLS